MSSAERTAQARLERLLHVLPAASRRGGAPVSELARALGVEEATIFEDLAEVTERNYYHPGGWLDDVHIGIEGDRIEVRASSFERPPRLTTEEALCLALALRGGTAGARLRGAAERARLLERAETHLARRVEAGYGDGIAVPERDLDPEGIRDLLLTAARERRACALSYLKPGAPEPGRRVVHPYVIAYGEGAWYAIGHCTLEDAVRIFRTDRVLEAELLDATFEVPADFEPGRYLADGRVFHADTVRDVRIRYSPRIARWIRERAGWESARLEEEPDGSVVLRHRVADPHWVVRHTLQYGADAEILAPEDVRALALAVARTLLPD